MEHCSVGQDSYSPNYWDTPFLNGISKFPDCLRDLYYQLDEFGRNSF